jgi:hypothetical protein
VKLGYNKPLGAAKFVSYNREFIITRIVYGITHGFGTKKFVHYNREFVITEFVITEFDCNRLYDRKKTSDRFCVQSRTEACIL